mgnify:FL=1
MTIRDIARDTGLSPTTISLVLNGGPGSAAISAATRAAVMAATRRLGYDLTRLRGRRRRTLNSVTIFCPEERSPNDPIHYHLVLTLSRVLLQHGCQAVLEPYGGWDTATATERLRDGQSDAAIVLASLALLRDMPSWDFPAVYIGDVPDGVDVRRVHVDNELGGRLAGEHLWRLGHRRLGVLQVPYGTCAEKRLEALRATWSDHGATLDPDAVIGMEAADHRLVAPAVRRLMEREEPPTALFCNSDWLASLVLRALRDFGLRIPEDISVVGFDDAHYAQLLSPPLTTVRQPFAELGALAVELLLEQASAEQPGSRAYVLPCALVARESTAPPRR